MKRMMVCLTFTLTCFLVTAPAYGQLDFGEDYTTSDEVFQVVHVKVDSNMVDYYLEGIKQTWAAANDLAVELGQMDSYRIYVSILQDSGDYNLTLVSEFKDLAQFDKGRTNFKAFEEAWLKRLSEEKQREIVKTYPGMRKIVGEYLVRRIDLK